MTISRFLLSCLSEKHVFSCGQLGLEVGIDYSFHDFLAGLCIIAEIFLLGNVLVIIRQDSNQADMIC